MKRQDKEAGVAEVASSASTQPSVHLRLEGLPAPGWLILQRSEGAEVTLGIKKVFDRRPSRGSDQFLLQVVDADEKAELLHLWPIEWRAQVRGRQSMPKVIFFACVTHAGDREVRSLRAEADEMTSNRVSAADRYDDDSLCVEIAATATGHRLECNLIAYPLDQYDSPGSLRPCQSGFRCRNRRTRTTDISIQGFSGQSTSSLSVHKLGESHVVRGDATTPGSHRR